MDTSIQQLNLNYLPKEDRLLLKVNNSADAEFRIWLTRRYTILLLKVLTDKMDTFGGVDAIAVSEEAQKEIKSGAFEKKYSAPKEINYPLGEEGVLAYQIKTTALKNNSVNLQFLPEKGKGLNFNLDKKLLFMLHKLLLQGIRGANWEISQLTQPPPSEVH